MFNVLGLREINDLTKRFTIVDNKYRKTEVKNDKKPFETIRKSEGRLNYFA